MYKFFKWYTQLTGWTFDNSVPIDQLTRSIVLACPHTSNWDFIYTMAAFDFLKVPARYTIKKEAMFFPLNLLVKATGGLPIDRSPKDPNKPRKSLVQTMVDRFKENEELCLLITPEGTRAKREKWKSGFYHIALEANVPIALSYLDFKTKVVGLGKIFYLTGDMDQDMRLIMDFYKDKTPKHPDRWSLDLRYI